MKIQALLLFLITFPFFLVGQSYISLQNDLDLTSGDNVKILADNYTISDLEEDGLIRLNDVSDVIIDGDSVEIDGMITKGFFIKIENCTNVSIRNFDFVSNFFYAVYITNSSNIYIEDCTFSENKRDEIGWIYINEGPAQAHGGGVFMNNVDHSTVSDCNMNNQNDGVAMYNSTFIEVLNNDLSWNTAYGVRMFYSDSCTVNNNNCSNANRDTDPSDCAAILMYACRENTITDNDFSHSGDGVFINDYPTMTAANNYIGNNDCSYSPHNAIEAVFSFGNVFKHNICNNSNYGFWAGYSWNTLIDSNTVNFNSGLDVDGGAGIGIEMGYNNIITNNEINNNSNGIHIWEDDAPILPYVNNSSYGYTIENNSFYGNVRAINATESDNTNITSNTFSNNWNDINLGGESHNINIASNTFANNAAFYIENLSEDTINAEGNLFPDDPDLIECKIWDNVDDNANGVVNWANYMAGPNLLFEDIPPADLNEPTSIWDAYYYVEDATPINISWDENDKQVGTASLYVETEAGFDVRVHYFPETGKMARWNLDESGNLKFWLKVDITDPNNVWGVQEAFIRIGNACGGYIQLQNESFPHPYSDAIDNWILYTIPVDGNSTWTKTTVGDVDCAGISYVEFNLDVWEWGFNFWLDGVEVPVDSGPYNYVDELLDVCAGESYEGYSETGIYVDTIPGGYGCTLIRTIDLTVADAILANENITDDDGTNSGAIVLFPSGGTGIYTFNWSNGATSQNINQLAADTYTVTITDSQGCESIASFIVGSSDATEDLGLYFNQFLVIPNPASKQQDQYLMLELKETQTFGLQINNSLGQRIWSRAYPVEKSVQVPLPNSLEAGVYFLKVKLENGYIGNLVFLVQ